MANTLNLGNGNWGTKENSLLGYNSESDNFKPLPFDFTRASNATRVNKEGLIETVGNGIPRVDFADSEDGALKLEPQSTNLFTYSEDFSQSVWSKTNCTIISNNSISPNGTQNADKLVENNIINSFSNRYSTSVSYTSGLKYTISIFAKSDGRDLMIRSYNGSSDIDTIFDLSNGIILSGSTGEIKDYGNGWYRCSHTITAQSTINTVYSASFVLVNNSSISYQGDGTSGIYIWGAQLEEGYPTSYIKTEGSTITRLADSCSQTPPSGVIGQTEGTIYAEVNISSIESVGGFSAFRIYDGTSSNAISFIMYPSGRIQATAFNGGSLVGNINNNSYGLTSGIHKIAVAYKLNDYILYVDGSVVGSDTSATVPATNKFDLSYTNIGSLKYNQTKLYNTRLSNSELQALTQV